MTVTHDDPQIERIDFTISMPIFDCTVSILCSNRKLTEQERAAFEEPEMDSDDELDCLEDEFPPTGEYIRMPILADGLEALKNAGSSIGALATFCMRYPFKPYTGAPNDKDREEEAAWLSKIVEIVQHEEMIQEFVQKHYGEVAGLQRRSRRRGQTGENPDLNASTKILCRFPDEATRDRVANEVVQKYQSFNVTVVETLEEDWWE